MKNPVVALVLALGLVLTLAVGSGAAAGGGGGPRRDHDRGHWFKRACGAPSAAVGACGVQVVTNSAGTPLVTSTAPPPGAYGPVQFHTAYSLPTTAPTAQTIGIVDAYNDPNIEADLASYDAQYGLAACTTANGCFRKVNQTGGTTYPATDAGWSLEIALDVETAREICQNCTILLVEANSSSLADLGAAENEAVALGANVISNSWGAGEYSGETSDETRYFKHPGVVITASSGDGAYGVEFPAASQYVTAVGGTTLNLGANNTYGSETAWADAGSGCSAYEPKPAWQTDTGCSHRTVADVSADADPNTGAAVYDSVNYSGQSGWFQVGGTSLASPLIASVYALTGSAASATYGSTPYAHTSSLHDVTSGSNGTCSPAYLCTGGAGYDGPTGLGTPNGLAAFTPGAPTPAFTVGVTPAAATVTQGTTASYTVTVGASGGFTGSVALTQSGLANGTFTPSAVTTSGTSTLTVNTSTLAAGTYPFTIAGTSGGVTHSVSASLVVQAAATGNFTLGVSPTSRTIARTSTTTYTVTITPTNGFAGAVSLSAAGFVSGVTGSFAPNPATGTSTLTVRATNARRRTRFTVTITGTSGSLSHSTTLTLTTN